MQAAPIISIVKLDLLEKFKPTAKNLLVVAIERLTVILGLDNLAAFRVTIQPLERIEPECIIKARHMTIDLLNFKINYVAVTVFARSMGEINRVIVIGRHHARGQQTPAMMVDVVMGNILAATPYRAEKIDLNDSVAAMQKRDRQIVNLLQHFWIRKIAPGSIVQEIPVQAKLLDRRLCFVMGVISIWIIDESLRKIDQCRMIIHDWKSF